MALKTMSVLSVLIVFSSFPSLILCASKLKRLPLPSVLGPLAFAFDSKGDGPYTGVADGRILKYHGSKTGFLEYGQSSPIRDKKICDGANSVDLATICGKPSGMGFYDKTGELFVADSIFGLVVIPPGGGVGKQLAKSAGGVAFGIPDALEVDQSTGDVYFTDASATYNLSQTGDLVSSKDTSGRLIKYDPKTKQVSVALDGLSGPTGVAISEDSSYVIVIELLKTQAQKLWLKGPKALTSEILLTFTGGPDKIRRTVAGDYWVAISTSPPNVELFGLRINGDGKILETLKFTPEFDTTLVTEVHPYKDGLYLGSLDKDFVGVFKIDLDDNSLAEL
ncbi:hypothetical protein LguiA_027983 [Lonicera macranthoides]